ncbi:MAG: MBL fold metallo-hydrolase [Actinomycetaceae bacterium]|nr:MBL fold metallo-hydrolase [Actinomycetaceae bacterium]MDU0970229.1 MBL fold metallo-hydrolase [Actinomycetaceae bacterium]
MRLVIVGSTGSMSGPRSAASCYLVQAEDAGRTYSLVLDMGPGGFGALWRVCDPHAVDAIALSHLHIDHCGDLMSMQIFRRWHPGGALSALDLLAPAGAVERMRGLDGFAGMDDDFSGEYRHKVLREGAEFTVGPMTIRAFPVHHTVESYALRVEGPGQGGTRVITYSGDTDECDGVVQAAAGADLFLCECGFTKADTARGVHLDGQRAARVARSAGAGRTLLTHIQPWTDAQVPLAEALDEWAGPIELADSGAVYEV